MKSNAIRMMFLFWIALSASAAIAQDSGEKKDNADGIFPDENLEAAVRQSVFEKRDTEEPLTKEDVAGISTIRAGGRSIEDLTGLEHCESLALLDLSNNKISDLTPLRGLANLQSLNLSGNRIEDLSPLSDLKQLQYLDLTDNRITDIAPFNDLTNLNTLYLSGNKIEDIKPLAGLSELWSLYLDRNPLKKNLDTLRKLPGITTLSINDAGISDLSIVAGLNRPRYLLLRDNKIKDLAPLVKMIEKDAESEQRFAPYLSIDISGNPLSDKATGKQIPALKEHGVAVHTKKPKNSKDSTDA